MYIWTPVLSCLTFEMQDVFLACSRAWAKTGKRMAARIAMMAMTTSSSIRVKAFLRQRTLGPCMVVGSSSKRKIEHRMAHYKAAFHSCQAHISDSFWNDWQAYRKLPQN